MKSKLKNKTDGFTIIEVLIVLAIAGLIMLIVFLAVPTLQRNSRNTQRNNDASLVLAAVNECINNRNGQTASCDTTGEIAAFGDVGALRQLTNVQFPAGAPAFPGNNTQIRLYFSTACNAAGDNTGGGTPRQFSALFNIEGSGADINRCING